MFRRFLASIIVGGLAISPILAQDKIKPKPAKPAPAIDQDLQIMLGLMKMAGADDEAIKALEAMFKDFPGGGNAQLPPIVPLPLPPIGPGPGARPAEFEDLMKQMQALQKAQMDAILRMQAARGIGPDGRLRIGGNEQEGRLGVQLDGIPELLREHLDLPKGQGMVFINVPAQSVAGKAGIKPNDILLEFNGKAVPSDATEFAKILKEVKPDTAVDLTIIRKGKKETIKEVKLPEAKAVPPAPMAPGLIPFPMFPEFPAFPGGNQKDRVPQIKVEQNDSVFSGLYDFQDLRITITGTKEDGKKVVESIEIQDGKETKKYESLDKIPEKYQPAVSKIMERLK